MKTVFVLYKSAYESQCATDTEVEIHQTLDSAKAALRKEYDEHLEMPDSEFYTKSISDDGMTADCRSGDWFYSYWIKEREVRQAEGEEQAGNAAAMREALCMIRLSLARKRWLAPYIGMVDAALAAPPRNCDVGTAEEQEERYDAFCSRHYGTNDMSRDNCRICPLSPMGCKLAWAQMPYEKEGGRGVK